MEKETHLRREPRLPPLSPPWDTLAARSALAIPTRPRGRIGGRDRCRDPLGRPTDYPRVLSAPDAEPLPATSRISKHRSSRSGRLRATTSGPRPTAAMTVGESVCAAMLRMTPIATCRRDPGMTIGRLSVNAPRRHLRNRIIIGRDGAPSSASRSVSENLPRVSRRVALCTRAALRALTGPLGRQLAGPMGRGTGPCPNSSPWAGRVGKGRSGSKGVQGGDRGGNRRSLRKWVSFSTRPPPPCLLRRFQRCH